LLRSEQPPAWETVFERDYQRPVAAEGDLREVAQAILQDCELEGAFWVQRPNANEIRINRFRFWDETRLTYRLKEGKLRAERQQMKWHQSLLRMHFRGGFQQPTFWDDLWAVLVDVACAGMVVWVVSGVVMSWRVPRLRVWSGVALAAGTIAFLLFVWRL
jgi:hypothetical protein